ncbi:DUF927 domain-containing protein [Methylomonas koyamae]|uniref:DUF927 domain-containing protein n=1 Tax=Methylomonas koyamae TaxID=702114 RepID=UPI0006CF9D28|nr:DUF927 domain-containing protein [Methylomonas koyamae]
MRNENILDEPTQGVFDVLDEDCQLMAEKTVSSSVGSVNSIECDTSPLEPSSNVQPNDQEKAKRKSSGIAKNGGTHGTAAINCNNEGASVPPAKNDDGTRGTVELSASFSEALAAAIDPLQQESDDLERLSFDDLSLPCFLVKDDWFDLGGKRRPGVWYCYQTEGTERKPPANHASFICSPLYVEGVTNTESGQYFGRLLRFRDTLGRWRNWAMPMEMLRGSCEELRGELLASGVEIDFRNRQKLADYLQWRVPRHVWTAATRTGWTSKGGAFVLHDRIIGDERVHFQSESMNGTGATRVGGDYLQWQKMAGYCQGNPVLMASIGVALSGPLLAKTHRDSGGVHWVGDSSTGKTTALCLGASVWGGEDLKRTWRATSNGLEGVAALLSDTCLCLDEINEADPREIGAIVYSLGNGTGKTRANRVGSARDAHRWRLSLLSTGERSISAAMQEGGKQAKAGQLVRLLNIPANRTYGVFDDLHHFEDGRPMSDFFKTECARHYGHAGPKFVEHILSLEKKGMPTLAASLPRLNSNFNMATAKRRGRLPDLLCMRWQLNWRLMQEFCLGHQAQHSMPVR